MQMKTSAWIVAAGMTFGIGMGTLIAGGPRVAMAAAPVADEKVDLTPRYTTGQKITFKQHTVRKDTMTLGGMPTPEKAAEGVKEASKSDAPKGDAPKADAPKTDAPKTDAPKGDAPKADAPKPDAAKSEAPKVEPPKAMSGPMSSTQTVDQTAMYELRVIEADDKGTLMELELKSVVATAELPQGKYTWDSVPTADDKDASNPIMGAFRPIVGAVVKIKVGADGNILEVQPDSRIATMPGGPLAPMAQQLVGIDGVRLRFGPVIWIKDGREAATIGKPWTNSDEMFFKAVGKFTYETTNTVKSAKDNGAAIDIAGVIKLGGIEEGKPAAGTLKEQMAKGSCTWDTKAGNCKSHTWEQKTVLDLKVGGAFDVVRSSEFTVTTTRE